MFRNAAVRSSGVLACAILLAAACTSTGSSGPPPTDALADGSTTTGSNSTSVAPPAVTPVARGYAMMADLPGEPGVVMLGGKLPSIPRWPDLPEMWTYVPEPGWQQLTPPALPGSAYGTGLVGTCFVFDTGSGKGAFVDGEGTTWVYDPATNQWEPQSGGKGPSAVHGAAMVYDAGSDRMIVFGGIDLGNGSLDQTWVYNQETWAYDLDTNTWERMDPERSPSPRNYYQMAYDAGSDRVILFGGGNDVETFGDTWAYDYEADTWTDMSPATSPPGRAYGWMAYDPGSDRIILYGGSEDQDTAAFDDTWAYDVDGNKWTRLPIQGPSARAWHAMSYEDRTEVLVLFGGGATRDEFTAESWLFDPRTDTWSQVA